MATKRTPIRRATLRRVTPEAVAAFVAGDEEALRKALFLRPWAFPSPMAVQDDEPCPYAASAAGAIWWPQCLELRRELRRWPVSERQRRWRLRLKRLESVVPLVLRYDALLDIIEALEREGLIAPGETDNRRLGEALGAALNTRRLALKK